MSDPVMKHWREIAVMTIHNVRGSKLPADVDIERLADQCVAAAKVAPRGGVLDAMAAVMEEAKN